MTLLSESAGILGIAVRLSIGRARFEFILLLTMAVGVVVLGETVLVSTWSVRAVPAQAGKAARLVSDDGVYELRLVWVKYGLGVGLEKNWGGLGGLRDVLLQIGCAPCGSFPPPPPPRWRSASTEFVTTVVQGEAIRVGLSVPLAWTLLVSSAFHGWRVYAALEDCESYMYVPGWKNFLRAL